MKTRFTTSISLTRRMGKPSWARAAGLSLLLHVAAFGASRPWWLSHATPFSAAGLQDAVYLEASFAALEEPAPPVRMYEFTPPEENSSADASDTTRSALQPAAVPMARVALHDVGELPQPREALSAPEVALPPVSAQRASGQVAPTTKETADGLVVSRTKRRATVELPVQSRVAIQQSAGLDATLPPDFTGNRPPSYPAEAVRRGLEGTVILRLHISAQGQIERLELSKSSGHAILDREAMRTVRTWNGQPARRAGRNVGSVELLPIRFRLHD